MIQLKNFQFLAGLGKIGNLSKFMSSEFWENSIKSVNVRGLKANRSAISISELNYPIASIIKHLLSSNQLLSP